MARMIPAAERIQKAHELIQKARDYPVPPYPGRMEISYMAQIKEFMRQARDLVKFIPNTPTATPEMKEEVKQIFAEIERTQKELLIG